MSLANAKSQRVLTDSSWDIQGSATTALSTSGLTFLHVLLNNGRRPGDFMRCRTGSINLVALHAQEMRGGRLEKRSDAIRQLEAAGSFGMQQNLNALYIRTFG